MREEATAAAALVQGDTQRRLAREADAAVRARNAFNTRNLVEQSAALSLAQLAEADPTFEIGGDQVHLLINELVVCYFTLTTVSCVDDYIMSIQGINWVQ